MLSEMTKTAAEWGKAIQHLREQLRVAEQRVATLKAKRAPDVLSAALGDEPAKTRLVKLDEQHAVAERELRDLKLAIVEANAELTAAEAAETKVRREADRAEAAKLEAKAARIAKRVDDTIRQIADDTVAIEKLLGDAGRLRGSRTAGSVITRTRYALRAAYWSGGLKVGDFVSSAHRQSFVAGLGALLGIDRPSDREENDAV